MKKSTQSNPLLGFKVFCSMLLVALLTIGNIFGQSYEYSMVTENQTDWSGTYLLTAQRTSDLAYVALSGPNSTYGAAVSVADYMSGTAIASNPTTDAYQVTIAATADGHYTMHTTSGYLGWSSGNSLRFDAQILSDTSKWDITFTNSKLSIANVFASTRHILYNQSSPRFACYTSSQTDPVLFKYGVVLPKTEAPVFSTAPGLLYETTNISLTSTTANAAIYYTLSGTTPDSITGILYTAPIAVSAATTIKAIAYSNSLPASNISTANYTFPTEVPTIAAFLAANTITNTTVYKITGDVTFVYRNDRYIFVQDATAGMLIYDNSTPVITNTYAEGDVISGGLCGTYTLYYGLSEFVPTRATAAATVHNGAITPTVVTLAELNANYSQYQAKLVKVKSATFAAGTYTTNSASNISIDQNGTSGVCRNHFKTLDRTMAEGFNADIVGFVIRYNTTVQLAPRTNNDITTGANALPFVTDFSSNTANVILTNGDQNNKWYFGQAQGFDNNKLFISSSNGVTNKYDITKTSVVHASVNVNIPANGALLSFDYRVNGENNYDYLQVALLDSNATLTAGTTPSSYITRLSLTNDYTHYTYTIPPTFAGRKILVFTWKNDNSGGTQFPASIDNLSLIEASCVIPTNLTATTSGSNATVTWTAPTDQTAWTFQYKLSNHSEWYTVNATSTSVTLSNLQGNSNYMMKVKADCGDQSSVWAEGTFTTPCLTHSVANSDITIGSGTSTQSLFFGGNYGFNYSANLYTFSQYGNIHNIAFYLNSANTSTGATFALWVKAVPASFTMSASNTFSAMKSGATLVYQGTPAFYTTSGWKQFTITNGITIPEGYKLLVLSRATGCSATGGCTKYARYTSSTGNGWYKQADSDDPGESVSGTITSNVPNIKFNIDAVICVDTVACKTPTGLTVSNVTANSADISWTAGNTETAWVLQYRTGDGEWTSVDVTANSYTLTGLTELTNYQIRLKAHCGNNNESEYTGTVAFTTIGICLQPTNLVYGNSNTTTTISWTPVGTETQWAVRFKEHGTNDWVTLTVNDNPSTTVGGLTPSTLYDFEVQAVCSAEESSLWTAGQFTSGCASYALPFTEDFTGTVLPGCWSTDGYTFNGYASSTNSDQWLVTPPVIIPSQGTTYIVFDIKTNNESTESYQIMASFRGTAMNNFYNIYQGTISGSNYQRVVVALPQMFTGTNLNIMFKHTSDGAPIGIDNVLVSQCVNIPTGLTVSNVTPNSVNLSWTSVAGDNAWVVEYSADNGSTWTSVATTTNPFIISGLTATTAYQFRVKTDCGDNNLGAPSSIVNALTACNVVSLPFSENFNSLVSGIPTCWDNSMGTTTTDSYKWNYYATGYSGAGLRFDSYVNSNGLINYLKTPSIYLSVSARLSFMYKNPTGGDFSVYISTDDGATMTALATGLTGQSTWTSRTINLSAYTLQTVKIIFKGTSNYGDGDAYVYLDNVVVEENPTCIPPAAITASNITETTANVAWTAASGETAWNIQYGPLGFTLGQGTTIVATSNPFTLTGLEGSSNYDIYVQAVCTANDQSEWSDKISIATACSIATLPFFEGFENTTFPPTCWSKERTNVGTGSYGTDYADGAWARGTSYYHTGSAAAQLRDTRAGSLHNLVTPAFTANGANSTRVSVWVYRNTSGSPTEGVEVWASDGTDLTAANNPVSLGFISRNYTVSNSQIPSQSASGWYNYVLTIPKSGEFRLIFEGHSQYGSATYMDDITVEALPTCLPPTAITASNITGTTATIAWTAASGETAWNIQYGHSGFTLGQGTIMTTTSNSINLTGLAASTTYDVYVKAACSETDQSAWSNVTSFTTSCGTVSLPFSEGFESTSLPPCWTLDNVSGTMNWTISTGAGSSSSSAYAGSRNAYFIGNDRSGATTKLITPVINLTSSSRLTFWHIQSVWTGDQNTLTVYYRTSATSAWIQLQSYTNSISTWTQEIINLPNPSATYQIAFEAASHYGYPVGLDNVVVEENPTCFPPTAITASNITSTTADLAWTAASGETAWNIQYGPTGFTLGQGTTVAITTNPYTLTGLNSSQTYDFYLQGVCSEVDHSQWSSATTFTTLPAKELGLTSISSYLDGCNLSNLPVSATVTSNGFGDTVRNFTISYQINDNAPVVENVTLAMPLTKGQTYTHTFATPATLTADTSVIRVTINYDGDENASNNTLSTRQIYYLDPIEVIPPYTQNFSNVTVNRMGWNAYDVNNDNVTWKNNGGVMTYTYNDTAAADDWFISPCFNLPAGKYQISYTYNALSPMSENLSVYMGMGATPADMTTLVGAHNGIVKTAQNVVYTTVIDIPTAGIYNFGVYANSLAGNMGVTFDNLKITPMVNVLVTTGANGTINPIGSIYVPYGNNQVFGISPDAMYHTAGVWVNNEQVVEEDMQNSRFLTYTLNNVIAPTTVNVAFNISQFVITGHVINYANYGHVVGHFVPVTDTVLFGDSYTTTLVLDNHYHLNNFLVNNTNVTSNVVRNGNTYTYTFDRVWENKDIIATVRIDTVAVIYNVHGGYGTVDGIANTTANQVIYHWLNYGDDLLATVIPNAGYHLVNMTVNDTYTIQANQWQFNNIVTTQNIDVALAKDNITITTTAYGNGTVSTGESFNYDPAHTYTFTATPAAGNHIVSILRNNQPLIITSPEAAYAETLTNITSDYNYVVRFENNFYDISAVTGANGTINPTGVTSYRYNTNATYTVAANTGYYISSITVDGTTTNHTQAENLNTTTLSFHNIVANHSVSATFAQYTYIITVTAGTNGTITPGTGSHAYGTTPTYTITPAAGYGIVDVLVDGHSVGAVSTYTFTALTGLHTISATFAQYQYTITAMAGNGGSITPNGMTNLVYHGTQAYTITPAAGYSIDNVWVDNVAQGAISTYTFSNVAGNHVISAAFTPNHYTITVNQPANGTITPGTMDVVYGATPTFVITPATGYTVDAITLNSVNVTNSATHVNDVYTYTLPAVSANQALTATMVMKHFTITATAGANGNITPAGTSTVNFGSNNTYTITPAVGYDVTSVVVDGVSVGAVGSYTFVNVVANHTINATFELSECVIPTNMYTNYIDTTTATFNWYHPNASSYDIQYKPISGASFTTVNSITGSNYNVTNLMPSTTYVWYVRAHCAANNVSEWSNGCSFRTHDTPQVDTTGVDDYTLSTVKVYSNQNNVYIVNNYNVIINQVEVFDIYGKLIYAGRANCNPEVISLNVANGTYIVRLATQQGMSNYKLYLGR